MNYYLIAFFLITSLLIASCKKSSKPDTAPQPVIKVRIVSGDGQTDTIGNPLNNPVIVEVTVDGVPKSGYNLQFQGSGCNNDNIVSTPSQPDGRTGYPWALAGDVGPQQLKIWVLDSSDKKADSVIATATALAPKSGWHRSACSVQSGSSPATFCKLSTGRLFTCFGGGNTYLRYSDDNGVSWNAVKSLGNSHRITWVLSTPADEVLAFTEGTDGTFYSKDGGQTWSNLGLAPFNTAIFSGIVFTPSGRLIAASAVAPPLSISTDKGKTWLTVPFSAFIPQNMVSPSFRNPTEDKDRNLYVIEIQDGNLFKSIDGGKTWELVPPMPTTFAGTDIAFYVDPHTNWFYRGTNLLGSGLFISKDKGITYDLLIPDGVGNMSVQSDGNLYYITGSKLFSFDAASGTSKLLFGNGISVRASAYILAKNNNLIVDNLGNLYIRYHN